MDNLDSKNNNKNMRKKNKLYQHIYQYFNSLKSDKKREKWLRGNNKIKIPICNEFGVCDGYELGYEDGALFYNGYTDNQRLDVKRRYIESTGEVNWLNNLVDKDFEDRLIEYLDSQLENGGKKK